MKIKTYVINLKDSVDRRVTVLAETANYLIVTLFMGHNNQSNLLKQPR